MPSERRGNSDVQVHDAQIEFVGGGTRGEQMQILVAPIDEQAEILQTLGLDRDTGLFDHFAQRRDMRRLALFAVSFRDVPVRRFGGVREQHAAVRVEQHDAA